MQLAIILILAAILVTMFALHRWQAGQRRRYLEERLRARIKSQDAWRKRMRGL